MRYFFLPFFLCVQVAAFSQVDSSGSLHDSTLISADSTTLTTTTSPSIETDSSLSLQSFPSLKAEKIKKSYPKNVVKVNIGSLLLFNNYNFLYERSITRKISASLGYRTMPTKALHQLPALEKMYDIIGEDKSSLEEDFSKIKASNKTYTAEFRFYAGRKDGPRGFYLGLYGRYATFNVDYDYLFEGDTKDYSIPLSSTTKGIGGGGFFGVQWLIGKRVSVDWQILGGHWGKLTGDGSSMVDLSQLSEAEKTYLKDELQDLLPTFNDKNIITANVKDNGVDLKLDGPFVGLRSGISIGIAF